VLRRLVGLVVAPGIVACFGCILGAGPVRAADHGSSSVDLEAFRELARTNDRSECVDEQALYLVDREYVVHLTRGSCPDAGGGISLFSSTPDQLLCSAHQTIAGPLQRCASESARPLFQVIIEHIHGEPDDVLPGHTLERVRWRLW